MSKAGIAILVALAAFFSAGRGAGICAEKKPQPVVRVLVADNRVSIPLSLKGRYNVYASNTDRVIKSGSFLSVKVTAGKDGLHLGDKVTGVDSIRIAVARDGNIYVDGRRFRGDMVLSRKNEAALIAVNRIGLDEYLYGVLYQEVSHRWPMEALKSQAITARTFALYQMRQNERQPYDLGSDIYSQVYGGQASEKWSTTAAVDRTTGEVLVYEGKLLPAYYHATCAGRTEDASVLWNVDLPPLKGVSCPYCAASPHYKWTARIPLRTAEERLRGVAFGIGRVSGARILSRDASGRVDKIEIKDGSGVSVILTGKDFRQIMGPNEVKSANFEISIEGDRIALNGLGWGHGVGMCQWGAFGMARRGIKAGEILKYYYPGAGIVTMDELT